MKTRNFNSLKSPLRYLYLLPALIIFTAVFLLPSIYSLSLSFYEWNGVSPEKVFIGFQNYITLITNDSVFWIAALNNLKYVLLTLGVTVMLGLLFAILINRRFYGRTLVRGVLYFPFVLSGIIVAVTWAWIYQPQLGMYNGLLELLGLSHLKHAWLADPKTAFIAVYFAALWHHTGQPMILFLAGLQTIPNELKEAATIDGANAFQFFRSITIPGLKETFVIIFATQFIYAMKVYDIIYGMTSGGPANSTQTLATYMVKQSYTFANVGQGSAIAWLLVAVLLIAVVPYMMHMARD